MTKYEFPTEPVLPFEGAFPAHANGGGNMRNWWNYEYLTIGEAAALYYGMHPSFAVDHINDSRYSGTLQRGLFYSTIEGLERAVMSGSIRTINLDIPSKKTDITCDTAVIAQDVLDYFGNINSEVVQQKDEIKFSQTERNTVLNPPVYLDPKHPMFSEELSIAIQAWNDVLKCSPGKPKQGSRKKLIENWLTSNYPKLPKEAKKRIAILLNPDKNGGAPASN